MSAPSRLPALASNTKPGSRPRRVKRGIVAGYIHDISPRHRATQSVAPASTPLPVRIAAVEPRQA